MSRRRDRDPIGSFKDQRERDRLKESFIRETNGILFRFSYRQISRLDELVAAMLDDVESGGGSTVKYMDPELYAARDDPRIAITQVTTGQ